MTAVLHLVGRQLGTGARLATGAFTSDRAVAQAGTGIAGTAPLLPRERQGMRLVLLGTQGGPNVNLHRTQASNAIVVDDRTYLVDATFRAATLDPDGIVIDIGAAARALQEITASLSYRNLDDEPDLAAINTTTERLCQLIGDRLATRARDGGFEPARLTGITVTLHESHIAWASYEVDL